MARASVPVRSIPQGSEKTSTSVERAARKSRWRIGGRYTVLETLGRGGMAVVYRVTGPGFDVPLALKQLTLTEGTERDAHVQSLFEREFHALAQLSHPRVIRVYDYGVDDRGPYYTMELLDGGDLRELAPLDYRSACRYALDVCSSLALLHSRRLVHRDVSPRNIRCTRQGHAKLIDFGAMVSMGPSTRVVGTPSFVAPEVVHRSGLDGRADLFSLGATLYYALTGHPPFLARRFGELQQAWRRAPRPPSALVATIPEALDRLVLGLLRIDPAERPRSAFEVMERLTAVAGLDSSEPVEVSHGYLSTPMLLGRAPTLRAFRRAAGQVVEQHRSAGLIIQGSAGMGRSRALDACVLVAKTQGMAVLRVTADEHAARPAGCVQCLAEQLDEISEARASRTEGARTDPQAVRNPARADDMLATRLLQASRGQPVLLAIDDADRADDRFLALVLGLLDRARDVPLLVLATAASSATRVFHLFQRRCEVLELTPLSRDETRELFVSVFGKVPSISLVGDQVFRIAEGRPRETMTLAQHMVDTGLVRYEAGNWTLPSQFGTGDLPLSPDEALVAKVRALPVLPRRIGEILALSLDGVLSRDDMVHFGRLARRDEIERALSELIVRDIVATDERGYRFAQRAFGAVFRAQLSEPDRLAHQRALAELEAARGVHDWRVAYHCLHAELIDEAMDRLAKIPVADRDAELRAARIPAETAARLLDGMLDDPRLRRVPRRKLHHLREWLAALGAITDTDAYYRAAPELIAQLEQDSGLADYRALDSIADRSKRLEEALRRARARYEATPESERGYPTHDAIHALARHVTAGLAVGTKARDTALLASLPALLEPFCKLSPLLTALYEFSQVVCDIAYAGKPLQGIRRNWQIYLYLVAHGAEGDGLLGRVRTASERGSGQTEAALGLRSVSRWIERLEPVPAQKANALYVKHVICVQHGDGVGAARYLEEAELVAAQTNAPMVWDPPWRMQLRAYVLARDLGGTRQIIDRIRSKARKYPGWVPCLHLAEGCLQALRGDFTTALSSFEQSKKAANSSRDAPPDMELWLAAVQCTLWCLTELGRNEEAITLGRQTLECSDALELDTWRDDVERELALAEARAGDTQTAARRLDVLLKRQLDLGVTGLRLAATYEARARVAIRARDIDSVSAFIQLGAAEFAGGASAFTQRLQEEARTVGIDVPERATEFTTSVLGIRRAASLSAARRVDAAMTASASTEDRAARALSLLCEAAKVDAGFLYVADGDALKLAAARGTEVPAHALQRLVAGYWAQQLEFQAMSTILSESPDSVRSTPGFRWVAPEGEVHHLLPLSVEEDDRDKYVALAVLTAAVGPTVLALPPAIGPLAAAIASRFIVPLSRGDRGEHLVLDG